MNRLVEARKDTEAAIDVWGELVTERMGERLEFAYIKGSILKKWESLVDYVPELSDIDIHVGTVNNQPMFPKTREGFLESVDASRFYEERFKEIRPDHLHIPRPQIVLLEPGREIFYPEERDDLRMLMGDVPRREDETEQDCQKRDREALLELKDILERQPERLIDRIGLEYYRIIRTLCYIVSPTPVRVLSQYADSKKAWKLNRTNVIKGLRQQGLIELADNYENYYLTGWKAFETGFNDNETMRELIKLAYDVLYLSYGMVKPSS